LQYTGLSRGAVSPTVSNSEVGIDPAPELTPIGDHDYVNGIGIIYGIRAIQRQDGAYISMLGSVLHDVYVNTDAENNVLGPQVGMIFARRVGNFSARLQATILAGFNFGDVTQRGTMGTGLVPGALNQPLYARSNSFRHEARHDEFSPSGELRAEARYRLRKNATLSLAWSGIAIGNALLAEERIIYSLPDFGLADPGEQSILVQNLYCGVEFVL
jgi:hypothetical protein